MYCMTPEEEKYPYIPRKRFMPSLVVCMGGRAAEEVVFDSVTTGAANDIQQATRSGESHGDPVWYVREVWSYGTGTRRETSIWPAEPS